MVLCSSCLCASLPLSCSWHRTHGLVHSRLCVWFWRLSVKRRTRKTLPSSPGHWLWNTRWISVFLRSSVFLSDSLQTFILTLSHFDEKGTLRDQSKRNTVLLLTEPSKGTSTWIFCFCSLHFTLGKLRQNSHPNPKKRSERFVREFLLRIKVSVQKIHWNQGNTGDNESF